MDGKARKLIDAAGAGRSVTSPGWLTELGRLWGGKSVRYWSLSHLQAIVGCVCVWVAWCLERCAAQHPVVRG